MVFPVHPILYNFIMSNKNSGARLELKKFNKETKQPKLEQKSPKPIVEQKSKEKDKKDKKDKNDSKLQQKQSKDKKDKKKDQKGKEEPKAEEKLGKSKDKKDKKQKQKEEKKDKKDKKDKNDKKDKKDKKNSKEEKSLAKSGSKSRSLLRKHSDKEMETINSINKTKMTIEELIEQYKTQAQRLLFQNHGYDPEKEREIRVELEELQKQKEKRHKRLEQLQEHQQQVRKSQQKAKYMKMQLRKEKIRERKVKRVEQKLSKIQIEADERKRDYEKFIEYVKERKKFKPRFKKYEQEYDEYLKDEEEDFRDKLDEITRKYEPMNQNQLISFEENYISQLGQGISYRQNKLKLQQDLIKQENERREKLLWKGRCHKNVSQEQYKRLEKKKEPWAKLEVIKEYGKMVAQNLKKKREQMGTGQQQAQVVEEVQVEPNQRLAYHQKYIKGVNYGLVPYEKPSPLSLEQKAKKGNSYLQQIRQMNKNRKNKTVDITELNTSRKLSASQDFKKDEKTFKMKKKSNPYYPTENNNKPIDFKNYESIEFSLEKINSIKKDRLLNDQIVKHGQYGSILDIQEKKRRGGSLVVKEINEKLNILNKL